MAVLSCCRPVGAPSLETHPEDEEVEREDEEEVGEGEAVVMDQMVDVAEAGEGERMEGGVKGAEDPGRGVGQHGGGKEEVSTLQIKQ